MSPRIGLEWQTILLHAIEIVDQNGFEAITLSSLAKKLNIRSPSLYNHFDGLKGLREELSLYGMNLLFEELSQAVKGYSKDEAVHALGKAYIAFSRKHPGLYEATIQAPDSQNKAGLIAANLIVQLVTNVLEDLELREEQTLHMVRGLRSLLHGFASLEQKGAFGLPLELDDSFQLLIEMFLVGVKKGL
ncbi:TetR/AcrR family transcriptional regulator [Bacillus sp. 2205SS5-2]|uniref:TetR/AcrR family transcriptional regulator n=1 Tax=Bacillus sp. 2205SS5-2 TaxID=3109031 RepID=UPI00300402C1